MTVSYDVTATLRAQMSCSHPPLVVIDDITPKWGGKHSH